MIHQRSWWLLAALGFLLSGCFTSSGGSNSQSSPSKVADAAVLTSIAVTPAGSAIPVGLARPFTATGTFSDGTTHDITNMVVWNSSDAMLAKVEATGVVTPLAIGVVTISATQDTVLGSVSVTVSDATLTSVHVTPIHPTIPSGLTKQFTATATYSSGISYDVTTSSTWSSNASTVASIDSKGVATALTLGSSDISATFGSMTGKATLVVSSARLETISISPNTATVPAGGTQHYTAEGVYSDGTSHDITSAVTWDTGDYTIALPSYSWPLDQSGIIAGLKGGTTIVTATLGNVSVYVTLTVTPAILQSIVVATQSATMSPGLTQQLYAQGVYTDGSSVDVTSQVTWASSNTRVITVDNKGIATAVDVGTSVIKATLGSMSGEASIVVASATLLSISITPNYSVTLSKGMTQQLNATGNYSDGTQSDITASVTWSSSLPAVAMVSSSGLVAAISIGYASITAVVGSTSADTSIYVNNAAPKSIKVTPESPSLSLGLQKQLTATATMTDSTTQDVTTLATWSSSNTTVATVNANGVVKLLKQGSVTVTATYYNSYTGSSLSGTTTITVGPASIQTIKIQPSNPMVANGGTQQFTVSAVYSDGSTQDVTSTAAWSSGNTVVASISNAGLATVVGTGSGTSVITAMYNSLSGTTTLTTSTLPITPNSVSYQIDPGHSGQVTWSMALTYPSAYSWKVDTGAVIGSPLIVNGRVFVLSIGKVSGELWALDELTGNTLWGPISIASTYSSMGGLAYDDGHVFALNSNGMLRAFDAITGQSQWSVMLNGQSLFTSPPVAANGLVYAKGAGPLIAVDQSTGAIVWSTVYWNGTDGSAAILGSSVYLSPPCEVDAYDAQTGITLWSHNSGCSGGGGATPAVNSNNILFSPNSPFAGGSIYNGATGALLGSYSGGVTPAIDATNAYVMGSSTLQSMSISNQQINWSFAGDGSLITPPIKVNQTIFIGSSTGKLFAVDAAKGSQLWSISAGTTLNGSGLAAAGGFLIVPTTTGVTAFRITP